MLYSVLLETLLKEIQSGKSTFEDIARRHSDCASSQKNGDLGRIGRGEVHLPVEQGMSHMSHII